MLYDIYLILLSLCAQLCPTLWDPMDCSLPGSSIHGFSQARIWSELPFPTPGALPDPGIESRSFVSPVLSGGFFTTDLAQSVEYNV